MTAPSLPTIAVGITCAPRTTMYLEQTIRSLKHQPVTRVQFYAEPGTPRPAEGASWWDEHNERQGNWRNWLYAATYLPNYVYADYYIIAEDDVVFAEGAIAALQTLLPLCVEHSEIYSSAGFGFLSLYRGGTHQTRVTKLHGSIATLAYPALLAKCQTVSRLWGACAMAFSRRSLNRIRYTDVTAAWEGLPASQERIERLGPAEVDGRDIVINQSAKSLGMATWFMYPSIVQHIGAESTVDNQQGLSLSRRATDYPQTIPPICKEDP